MKIQTILALLIISGIILFLPSCSSPQKMAKKGKVIPKDFYAKTSFTTAKTLAVLPCTIDGVRKNFLFDTGAQVNTVQRDSLIGKTVAVRGASNRVVENGTEIVKSFKIGDVEFRNTFATNENIIGLKDKIPNFGGVLGYSIIGKANWLIDYPNKTVEISNRDLSDDSFMDIKLDKSTAAPYTYINVGGKAYKVILDLGSTSILNVQAGSELAKYLLANYAFQEKERERYTVGGMETITEQIGYLPKLKIGSLAFENIRVNISISSQSRLGMSFFTDYIIYIDNDNRRYRIKHVE